MIKGIKLYAWEIVSGKKRKKKYIAEKVGMEKLEGLPSMESAF